MLKMILFLENSYCLQHRASIVDRINTLIKLYVSINNIPHSNMPLTVPLFLPLDFPQIS